VTARPSPSLPQNTQRQQKPGPRGSSEHWRRTPNHCQPRPGQPPGRTGPAPETPNLLRPDSPPARASRPCRTGRPRDSRTRRARHHLAHHDRRSRLARRPRQSTSPRRGRRRRSTTKNRTGTAHGRRTGRCTGRGPRNLHPADSADQPQTRRSPAQRSRLHPRPGRRGLPRQQREDPPGPPLGPRGAAGRTHTPENAEAAQAPPRRRTRDRQRTRQARLVRQSPVGS
jgi:hypothetical protein